MREKCARVLVAALMTGAIGFALAMPAIFATPHNALIGDMIVQNLGWKRFLADQLRHGHLPLWNPLLLGGAPFLAAGQYQALYPLGAFFLMLPAAWAYGPYTALHLGLAGVFTFAYLRLIGERRPGAMVGAVTFAMSWRSRIGQSSMTSRIARGTPTCAGPPRGSSARRPDPTALACFRCWRAGPGGMTPTWPRCTRPGAGTPTGASWTGARRGRTWSRPTGGSRWR